MKRMLLAVVAASLLSGCAGMQQQAAQQKAERQTTLAKLAKCDPVSPSKEAGLTKESFSKLLADEARSASADEFIYQQNIKILRLSGNDEPTFNAILKCRSATKKARIDHVKPLFEKRKAATKQADEKKALIAAYSAWETYVNGAPDAMDANGSKDFDAALSYYRNM